MDFKIDHIYRLNNSCSGAREATLLTSEKSGPPNMLTAKGKYGLKAVAHLAGLKPAAMAQATDISGANNIPKKFLDAILGELRKAGIVYSRKGRGGGYRLARPATEIRLGQVVRALDGPIAPIACARRTSYQPCQDCDDVKRCKVRLAMTKVRDAMSDILDTTTVADMLLFSDPKKAKLGRKGAA